MADDPVLDQTPPPQGLTETEMRTMIGTELDSRFEALKPRLDKLDALDLEKFRTDVLGDISGLFTKNKTEPMNQDDLLSKVGEMLDGKLKTIGVSSPKRVGGWLSRSIGF